MAIADEKVEGICEEVIGRNPGASRVVSGVTVPTKPPGGKNRKLFG